MLQTSTSCGRNTEMNSGFTKGCFYVALLGTDKYSFFFEKFKPVSTMFYNVSSKTCNHKHKDIKHKGINTVDPHSSKRRCLLYVAAIMLQCVVRA